MIGLDAGLELLFFVPFLLFPLVIIFLPLKGILTVFSGGDIKSDRCQPLGPGGRARADGMVLRARRGVGGDVRGSWPCHWHARITQRRRVGGLEPKNCVLRRGRLVSGFGQKKEKSTTCEPSTLRRSAWSRPSRGQRSASTSSPRRARTRHWKWAG